MTIRITDDTMTMDVDTCLPSLPGPAAPSRIATTSEGWSRRLWHA
jgi:hypothetical protein